MAGQRATATAIDFAKNAVKAAVSVTGWGPRSARRSGGGHIVMFHGVGDGDLPTDAFRAVLRWLTGNFEIVALGELVDRLRARTHGRMPHCVALTFDDGLKNNRTVAQPVLQDAGLPATFFVCPGLIDEDRRLWTHEARFRLEFVRRTRSLDGLERWGYAGGDPVDWMKTLHIERRTEVEQWIVDAAAGLELDACQDEASQLMDWDDIRSLDQDLITVGSHTLTHPMLSSLPPDDAEREIVDSAIALASKLDRDIDFFCYPNGDHRPEHVEIVREHYRAAVGTTPGVNVPGRDLFTLRRVPVSPAIRDFAWSTYRASR